MCSIFYHWVYMLMFEGHFIEYVCWWEFVYELSKTLHSLYSFFHMFREWDEWPSFMSSRSLSLPSLHSLLMWLPFIFDLSGSSLILVFCVSSSSSLSFLIRHFHFTSYSFLTTTHFRVWYSLCIIIIHLIISLICFICLLIDIIFTLGSLRSMDHGIFYTCCISYMRAWVMFIGYLGLVSLHFYHPITLAYIMSCVLRPWDHPEAMRPDVVFYNFYLDKCLRSSWYLDIVMLLLLGDTTLMFRFVSSMDLDY